MSQEKKLAMKLTRGFAQESGSPCLQSPWEQRRFESHGWAGPINKTELAGAFRTHYSPPTCTHRVLSPGVSLPQLLIRKERARDVCRWGQKKECPGIKE